MADLDFEALFSGEGLGIDAVPEGPYKFRVADARSKSGKGNGTVFLDLEILEGPYAGQIAQVTLYIPDGSGKNPRGALFHFRKKTAGFSVPAEVGRAMNGSGEPAPILAEALIGQVAEGELTIQSDGEYQGQNQLGATKPVDDAAPATAAPVQPVATEAPVTEPEPAPSAPAAAPAAATEVPF